MDSTVPGERFAMNGEVFSLKNPPSVELEVPDFGMTDKEMVDLFKYFGWYEDDQPVNVAVVVDPTPFITPPCPTRRRRYRRRPLCNPFVAPAETEEEDKENARN